MRVLRENYRLPKRHSLMIARSSIIASRCIFQRKEEKKTRQKRELIFHLNSHMRDTFPLFFFKKNPRSFRKNLCIEENRLYVHMYIYISKSVYVAQECLYRFSRARLSTRKKEKQMNRERSLVGRSVRRRADDGDWLARRGAILRCVYPRRRLSSRADRADSLDLAILVHNTKFLATLEC